VLSGGRGEPRTYGLAAHPVVSDTALPALAPFSARHELVASPLSVSRRLPPREAAVYHGEALVGGRMTEVRCTRAGGRFVIRVAGAPPLLVGRGGCALVRGGLPAPASDTLNDVVLGPGLILALALRDTFTLHAAAVRCGDAAVLLLGESGAGKSTLARALAAAGGERLADDVLPCECDTSGLRALPHYPQLKLPETEQYAAARPARVPIGALYVLAGAADARAEVGVEELAGRAGVLALAARTVAARLFDAALLERHLAFCAAAAAAVRPRRVRFRKRLDALPAVVAAILDDAAARRARARRRR